MVARSFFVAALLTCTFFTGANAELLAGAAKRGLVPPFPMHMGGFGDRMEYFQGVHDELYARALVLDDGQTALAIIGSGLMNLDAEMAELVRQQVHKATGMPRENVMVSCVHNHSAPSYYQFESESDKQKSRKFMAQQFADAAIEAYQTRVPAEAGYRAGEIRGATRNRQQDNEDVLDTQVGVIRVEEKDGRKIIATLCNFTGHPVILGSDNLLLSGEFPGAASRAIEDVLGGVAVFTQGACGDVTVHRSGPPFLEIERLGRLIAGEVIKTAEFIRPSGDVRLAAGFKQVRLTPKELPDPAVAKSRLDNAKADLEAMENAGRPKEVIDAHKNKIRLLSALREQAVGLHDGTLERPEEYDAVVQVMQVGDVVLAAVPGELFVEYALEMRQRSKQLVKKDLLLVGFANGYVGYIVTPRAMRTGGYEASVARVNHEAGRKLTETAIDLIVDCVR